MHNVIISNESEFERKKKTIQAAGVKNLHVITDFDATLSKEFVEGKESNTSFAQVQLSGLLGPDFERKSLVLRDYYHPIELSNTISEQDKAVKMTEWTEKAWKLMIDSGLTRQIIDEINAKKELEMRAGSFDFLSTVVDRKIPLLIYSGGIQAIIEGNLPSNLTVDIISNYFIFDKQGSITGWRPELIDSSSKTGDKIVNSEYYKKVKDKQNVVVLGDLIEDLKMLDGLTHDEELRFGFLNQEVKENLEAFKKHFDVVILNDGEMSFVNEIFNELIH